MKLWKVICDTDAPCVREVEGAIWPGVDEDGDTCFENTHFVTREKALAALVSSSKMRVRCVALLDVREAEMRLREAQVKAAEAVKFAAAVQDYVDAKPEGRTDDRT